MTSYMSDLSVFQTFLRCKNYSLNNFRDYDIKSEKYDI